MATTFRINVIEAGGDVSIAEMELFTTLEGSDISGDATMAASSVWGGLGPQYVIDNNGAATIWASTGSPPQWIEFAFSYDVPYLAKITMQARTGEPWQTPYVFEVLRSDDGGAFQKVFTGVAISGWAGGETKTFLNPFAPGEAYSCSRIKFNITSNGYGWPCCADLKVYAESGGANLAVSRRIHVNNENAGWRYNAIDGNVSTKWQTSAGIPSYLELEFEPALPYIHSFSWTARNDDNGNEAPYSMQVLRSTDDGASYTTDFTLTGMGPWNTGETKTFANPNPPPSPLGVLAEVYQGATLIATRTLDALTATDTDYPLVLTAGELALITSPSALAVRFTQTGAGTVRVSALNASITGTATGTAYTRAVAAALTLVGAAQVQSRRVVMASVLATSTVSHQLRRTVLATIAPAAAVFRVLTKGVMASLTAAAASTQRLTRALAASITAVTTVTLLKVLLRTMAASLTPSTTVSRRMAHLVTVSLTATATAIRFFAKGASASITASTTLRSRAAALRQAAIAASTAVTRAFTRSVGAMLPLTATANRLQGVSQLVGATLAVTATVRSQVQALKGAILSVTAAVNRRAAILVSALSTPSVTLVRQWRRAAAASVATTTTVTRIKVIAQAVTASLTLTAAVRGRATIAVSAVVSSTRLLSRSMRRSLAAAVAASGAVVRQPQERHAAQLVPVGVMSRDRTLTVAVQRTIAVSGRLIRSTLRKLLATILPIGTLDFLSDWSGWVRADASMVTRYTPEAAMAVRSSAAQIQQRVTGADQMTLLPAEVQLRQADGTGQVTTQIPGPSTLRS